MVETEDGRCLHRNRWHIQPATELVPGRAFEAQVREEPEELDVSTRQTSCEQVQHDRFTKEAYRTRSERAVCKPERYGQ